MSALGVQDHFPSAPQASRNTGRSGFSLYKMGARYYDPQVGRFTQADPIAMPNPAVNGGRPWFVGLGSGAANSSNAAFSPTAYNVFVYVGGDPLNRADPSGYGGFNLGRLAGLGKIIAGGFGVVLAVGAVGEGIGFVVVGVATVNPLLAGAGAIVVYAAYLDFRMASEYWREGWQEFRQGT